MNSKVYFYFQKSGPWQDAIGRLRNILLDCQLTETLKWGCPCYMFEKNNIVLIHVFKDYCGLLFFKGALMTDPKGVLIQQSENVQSGRQIRFTDAAQVSKLATTIKQYVFEAIKIGEAGLKVEKKPTAAYAVPEEFQKRLEKSASFKKAFEALTPGRQRAYLLHFAAAKQSATRESRIDKVVPKILEGKGLMD